jgi:hypothetical protein
VTVTYERARGLRAVGEHPDGFAITASKPRSARFDWGDGETRVNVGFTAKGEAKSAVALQHERLSGAEEAERMKAFWRERVAALKEVLER